MKVLKYGLLIPLAIVCMGFSAQAEEEISVRSHADKVKEHIEEGNISGFIWEAPVAINKSALGCVASGLVTLGVGVVDITTGQNRDLIGVLEERKDSNVDFSRTKGAAELTKKTCKNYAKIGLGTALAIIEGGAKPAVKDIREYFDNKDVSEGSTTVVDSDFDHQSSDISLSDLRGPSFHLMGTMTPANEKPKEANN